VRARLKGRAKSKLEKMIFSFEEVEATEEQVEGAVEEGAIVLDEMVFLRMLRMEKV